MNRLVLVALLLACPGTSRADTHTLQRVAASVGAATVPVVALESDAATGRRNGTRYTIFGTGFVFQWGRRVVTSAAVIDAIPARHLLPTPRIAVLVPAQGSTEPLERAHVVHAVRVTLIDRALDVALLEADADLTTTPLRPSTATVTAGTGLLLAGFHEASLLPTLRRVEVAGTVPARDAGGTPLHLLGGLVGLGSGGGPAVDPTTGEVVGMTRIHARLMTRTVTPVEGIEPETPSTALVIPIKAIMGLLEARATGSD